MPTLQPVDGHPGVVQPRAAAVRALRARRRPHRRAAHAVPGHRRRRGAAERPVRRRQPRRRATLAVIREVHDPTGVLVDPHTAVGIGAARSRRTGDAPMVAWPPPTRPSSPTPWSGPPASARRCRRGWPTCSSARSATTCSPTRSRRSAPTSWPPSPTDRSVSPPRARGAAARSRGGGTARVPSSRCEPGADSLVEAALEQEQAVLEVVAVRRELQGRHRVAARGG